jgi:ZIP family zinc transporter
VALVMGFGAGALISALAFDLTEESFQRGGTLATAAGLATGAITYFIGDSLLQRRARRRAAGPRSTRTSGLAILLGTLLDGLPESIVLGATLIGGASVSLSLLAAIFLSNVPEGVSGGRDLSDEGHPRRFAIGVWVVVAVASGIAAGLGNAVLSGMASR